MKIYISYSGNYDYEKELYLPIKQSGLYRNHKIFLPHESHNIDSNLKDILGDIDLVVAEVSHASTGQGIELGRAYAAGVPIVCFYKSGSKPSSSLRFITDKMHIYSTTESLLDSIEKGLG